jgi:hypothetical protein
VYIKNISTSTFSSRPSSLYPLSNSSYSGKYKYDYNVISYDIKSDIKINTNYQISFYANYGFNSYISKGREFYSYGGELNFFKNGFKKGYIGFNYRKIERDAFMDIFPDIAAYGGATGMKSYRITGCVNLNKNIYFSPYYIYSEPIDRTYKNEKAYYADFNLKF